jgi:hypothetical protein
MYVFKYTLTMNANNRGNCVYIETKLDTVKHFDNGETRIGFRLCV